MRVRKAYKNTRRNTLHCGDLAMLTRTVRVGCVQRQSPHTTLNDMQIYMVGGAVRDRLMGQPMNDRDWVVVGATPDDMTARGYLAVGRDFPVFLHPETHEEYALARTERKNGRGYRGFVVQTSPDVTLEEDLSRRDLTVNAMAAPLDWDGNASAVVDPYNGQRDLQAKVLRHVTDAFREDPVRILRIARFSARFADYGVAPETMALMQEMVADGEVDHLVPERVWQELSRGLMEPRPSRMFDVLRECGALARLLPELDALWGVPQRAEYHPEVDTGVHVMMVIDMAAKLQAPLEVRFASLMHDLGKGTTPADILPRHINHEERGVDLVNTVCDRWRVPNDLHELAVLVAREHGNIHRSKELNASALLRLFERCDAVRKPQRFADALFACECDARGRLGFEDRAYPQRARLNAALQAVLDVKTGPIAGAAAKRGLKGEAIGAAVADARREALRQWLAAEETNNADPAEPQS